MGRLPFQRGARLLLLYTLAVVLGGAFVRVTGSGDGCGSHWPTCHGRLLPHPDRLDAQIEFAHRLFSGLLVPLLAGLALWARRLFAPGHPARAAAAAALALLVVEALLGAGLVLFGLVGENRSWARAVAMPAHLVTTFFLLAALALAGWYAGGREPPRLRGQGALGRALAAALLVTLLLGASGAVAALGDTLYPPGSAEGAARAHLAPSARALLGLRIYHPLLALAAGGCLLWALAAARRRRPAAPVPALGRAAGGLFKLQFGAGLLNLHLLAPAWMQLVHLLLADLFWLALVLFAAAALGEKAPAPAPAAARPARAGLRDYVALTKPRVISLLLLTVLAAMAIAAGGQGPSPWLYLAVGLGFTMAAGAANAINMVLERDLDLRMARTAKRPTVTRLIPPAAALSFALGLAAGSFLLLWRAGNLLTAGLAMGGLAFYVVVYTLLLKRRTWSSIVIGGAAGAFPPLVGWAAVAGRLDAVAWCLFAIVFLWTPVHFWALAILLKEDYARAGVPMLPVVRGERATAAQVAVYALLTAVVSVLPLALPGADGRPFSGLLYLGAAAPLNGVLLARSLQLYRRPDAPRARSLFRYSLVYLALLFLAMAADRVPPA